MPADVTVRALDFAGRDDAAVAKLGPMTPNGATYVAEVRDKVVAWCSVRTTPEVTIIGLGWVAPRMRRKGVATALAAHVEALAPTPMGLIADADNEGLIAFARSRGMVPWRELDNGQVVYRAAD